MGMLRRILCAFAVLSAAMSAYASEPAGQAGTGGIVNAGETFLEQLQKRDSVLVADQLKYGFKLSGVKEGTMFGLPDLSHGICDSVEVLSGWTLDTLKISRKKAELDLEGSFVITSFDEGAYRLPDIAVQRISADGSIDTLVFAGKTLDVRTIPVDTATFRPHDIKAQARYPLTLSEILPYVLGIQLAAVLVILIVSLLKLRRKKSSGETGVKEPAYIVALRKLDKFRGNKLWAPEKQKQFYSGITDVMREYMAARFGIGAMEMTTAEIFAGLEGKDIPQPVMDEARNLFVMSDLVKFAKMTVSDEDNAKAVPSAVRFVTSTWKTAEETEEGAREEDADKTVKEGNGNVL